MQARSSVFEKLAFEIFINFFTKVRSLEKKLKNHFKKKETQQLECIDCTTFRLQYKWSNDYIHTLTNRNQAPNREHSCLLCREKKKLFHEKTI